MHAPWLICGLLAAFAFTATAPAADEVKILMQRDFEDASIKPSAGTVVADNTYNGSKGAAKSKHTPDSKWFSHVISITAYDKGLFTIEEGTFLSFAYYAAQGASMKIQVGNKTKNKSFVYYVKPLKHNEWTPVVLDLVKLFHPQEDKTINFEAGDVVNYISFLTGKPKDEHYDLLLDDIYATAGGAPEKLALQIRLAQEKDEKKREAMRLRAQQEKEALAKPDTDFYHCNLEVVEHLRTVVRKDKVTAKKWMVVGGINARDKLFAKPYADAKAYSTPQRYNTCKNRMRIGEAIDRLKKYLGKEKPEILFIMLGPGDVLRDMSAKDFEADLSHILKATEALGAIPLMINLPPVWSSKTGTEENELTEAYNEVIQSLAEKHQLPYVDAHALVLAEKAPRSLYASSNTKFSDKGHAALSQVIEAAYTKLEQLVLRQEK